MANVHAATHGESSVQAMTSKAFQDAAGHVLVRVNYARRLRLFHEPAQQRWLRVANAQSQVPTCTQTLCSQPLSSWLCIA